MPFLFSCWQFSDAGFGNDLLSPYFFSDAALFHYSAWFKATFAINSYAGEVIAFSPYESLLSLYIRIFGHSNTLPFVLNGVLSGIACLSISLTTRRLFGLQQAWFAIALYTLCAPLLFFSGITLKTTLVVMLASLANLAAVCFLETRRLSLLVVFGVLIVVAAIERVHLLTIWGVMLVMLLILRDRATGSHEYLRGAIVLAGLLAAAFLVSMGNFGAEPKYFSNIGLNVYIGHSKPDNFTMEVAGVRNDLLGHRSDAARVAAHAAERPLSQFEVSRYWLGKTAQYIMEHPASYVRGQLQKVHHLFAKVSISFAGERLEVWRDERLPLKLALVDFGVLFALFCGGIWIACKRDSGRLAPGQVFLAAGAIAYLLSLMLTFPVERYRLVVLVYMIPIAADALVQFTPAQRLYRQAAVITLLVFVGTYALMLTAPAGYASSQAGAKAQALERDQQRSASSAYYQARAGLDHGLTATACEVYIGQLQKLDYAWDINQVRAICDAQTTGRSSQAGAE